MLVATVEPSALQGPPGSTYVNRKLWIFCTSPVKHG